jgi:rhomboid family GlyGly-CTERM serine protease
MKNRNLFLALLIALAAAIISLNPALAGIAVYDRGAVLDGEIWRLFTAPLVHFAPTHFAYDSFALVLVAALTGWRGYRGFGWVCGVTPPATGLVVLALEPHLAFYGGLSGVATAALILLAFHGSREPGAWRWVCAAVLLATGGKTVFEAATGEFAFISVDSTLFKPVWLCHLSGILVGAAVFGCGGFLIQRRSRMAVHVINKCACENVPSGIGKGHGFIKIFQSFPRETYSSSIPLHVGARRRRNGV